MAEKKGFFRRLGGGSARYVGRRFGNQFINQVGRDSLTKSYSAARDAMRVQPISRKELEAGLNGRYRDGGRARFRSLMTEKGLTEADLSDLANYRRKNAYIMLCAAVLFLAFGVWSIIGAKPAYIFIYASSTFIVSLVFFSIYIRHDYARWQIVNRRFGSFREYIAGRDGTPEAGRKDLQR